MPSRNDTVGLIIQRLFPFGFLRNVYFTLLQDYNPELHKHIIGKIIFDKIDKDFSEQKSIKTFEKFFNKEGSRENRISVEKFTSNIEEFSRYTSILNEEIISCAKGHILWDDSEIATPESEQANSQISIPSIYRLPPLSPFDMFALASMLVKMSGIYHHVQPDRTEDSKSGCSGLRKIRRELIVLKQDRESWERIAQSWTSLDDFGFANKATPNKIAPPYRDPDNNHGLLKHWTTLLKHWDAPVYEHIDETEPAPNWWEAAYALMAIADSAAIHVGHRNTQIEVYGLSSASDWEMFSNSIVRSVSAVAAELDTNETPGEEQLTHMSYVESLSFANRSIVNVLPKSRTAPIGCTLRSTSLNLANLPGRGTIRVGWFWPVTNAIKKEYEIGAYNLLLIPYPYKIRSKNFQPTSACDIDSIEWGTFSLDVKFDYDDVQRFVVYVIDLIKEARKKVGKVHGVILPELSVGYTTVQELIDYLLELEGESVEFLCAGIREHPKKVESKGTVHRYAPANAAFMATLSLIDPSTDGRKDRESNESALHAKKYHPETIDQQEKIYEKSLVRRIDHRVFHEKHHRWRLTESQLRNYGLTATLDPSRIWWEDIPIVNRRLPIIATAHGWTVTSLICEDLARNDPARQVVESIGPNLVISLLMDGPQIPERWPARYASVLADDPGSSVLSMTSMGLIERANDIHKSMGREDLKENRSFALWRDDQGAMRTIELEENAHAVILSLSQYRTKEFAIDGRENKRRDISLRLTGVRQVTIPDKEGDGYIPWEAV